MKRRRRQRYRQAVTCRSTGKVQYIHVTERVTMMQTQIQAPVGAFGSGDDHPRHKRGVIKGRSRQSYRRLLWAIAGVAHGFRYGAWFVTLTHGKLAPGWSDSKHLFLEWKRQSVRKFDPMRGLWVAESQKRGAPHYHCLLTGGGPAAMGWMQLKWLSLTGCEGSRPIDRKRHAFQADAYGESQSDAAVEKYLAKVASREFAKSSQQDRKTHTGRTWGWFNRPACKRTLQQVDFVTLEPADVNRWFVERAAAALAIAGQNAGAEVVTDDGEFIRLCHASTVDFSSEAHAFLAENGHG